MRNICIQDTLQKLQRIITRFAATNPRQGAFYAMSPTRVQAQVDLWRTQLPAVRPHYAVKCNPEPLLLNQLYDAGVSFDCASERELLAVRELARGPVASRIVYANPCKSARDLAAAVELGAPMTVVDSVEELEKLEGRAKEGGLEGLAGYKGGALVRIAPDDTASAMPFSTKFGCGLDEVKRIADAARALWIPLHGISFHVGSGCSSGSAFIDAIRASYAGLLELRAAGHRGAAVLDIGGGFLADEKDFRAKAMHIRGAIMEIDAAEKDRRRGPLEGPVEGIRWIAEPGRFFAADAMDFFVQVIGKKPAGGRGGGWKYTLDDSLYGQFSNILFDYQKPVWSRVRPEGRGKVAQRKAAPGTLFGRTCDSVDVIARAEMMEELEVGDWLWFPRMGAYTRATASEFNGFPRPPVILDGDLPAPEAQLRDPEFYHQACRGVTYMPPVSARAFWAAALGTGKN